MKRILLLVAVLLLTASVLAATEISKPPRQFSESGTELREDKLEVSIGESKAPEEINDYLAFPADPNETDVAIARLYYDARGRIAAGEWAEAIDILQAGVRSFPGSRHLHQQLATLLWYWYNDREASTGVLRQAADEAVTAHRIARSYNILDYELTSLLAQTLGRLGDQHAFDEAFAGLIDDTTDFAVLLDYARGLVLLGNPAAETNFEHALVIAPEGNDEAAVAYAEWLLDHGRERDLIERLSLVHGTPYLDFLVGVAYDRRGHFEQALERYRRYAPLSESYPAPDRFRVPGSDAQERTDINFATPDLSAPQSNAGSLVEPPALITSSQAIKGLSYLLYREARGESTGGQRAEGWVVRNRVLRGSMYPTSSGGACPAVTNSGSTLADQYKSVMCQGNGTQFNGVCLAWCSNPDTTACSQTSSTASVASDVYNGYAPDPVGQHCPKGFQTYGSWCSSSTKCKGYTNSYHLTGPAFNYGTSGTCPALCAPTSHGKVCGNGSADNCFYATPRYVRTNLYTYTTSSLNDGQCGNTAGFSVSSGTHKGHLEGPENSSNPDFDLYLQKSSGSSWTTVKSSTLIGSVEDISYSATAGTYRWRICSYSGAGAFKLYTQRP